MKQQQIKEIADGNNEMKSFISNKERLVDFSVLFLLVLVVYGRTIGHDFQRNWDDNWYILFNDAVTGFSWQHLRDAFTQYYVGFYAPLQIVSYMLDYSLWGLWPGGFLFSNIVFHTANGLLLYNLLRRWQGDRLFAFFSSAIFLLHPVQVESVAWISQRKSLLGMFLFLIAWECYCRYRDVPKGMGRCAYAASLIAFVLCLLTKSTFVVLPVVLVLYDRCFLDENQRQRYLDKIPYIVAAGFFSALVLYTQLPEVGGGGRSAFHGGSPLATFYTMLPVFCRYLGMLIWPAGLSAEYAPLIRTGVDAAVVLSALLLSVIALTTFKIFKTNRQLAFWILFFWIGLLPVSQIVPIRSLMYDHYLYLPIMGAAVLAGYGAVLLRDRLEIHNRALLYALLLLPIIALSVASYQRSSYWKDSLTLWSDAVIKEPASAKAWEILAGVYTTSGDMVESQQAYEQGFRLDPQNSEILQGLGALYTQKGELDKGFNLLKKLVEVTPAYVTGWASLGTNYMKRGNYAEAEKAYKRAQTLQPDAMQVVMLLGNLALIQGHLDQARSYYNQVEATEKNNPESALQLACMEAQVGRTDEAFAWLEKSLQRGYRDYSKLQNEQQLSSLWQDPRFNYLLQHYVP